VKITERGRVTYFYRLDDFLYAQPTVSKQQRHNEGSVNQQ